MTVSSPISLPIRPGFVTGLLLTDWVSSSSSSMIGPSWCLRRLFDPELTISFLFISKKQVTLRYVRNNDEQYTSKVSPRSLELSCVHSSALVCVCDVFIGDQSHYNPCARGFVQWILFCSFRRIKVEVWDSYLINVLLAVRWICHTHKLLSVTWNRRLWGFIEACQKVWPVDNEE